MAFLEEIKAAQNEQNNKKDEIINEIVDKFCNKFATEEWESKLKNRIIEEIKDNKQYLKVVTEYHRYSAGCGNTYFRTFGAKFELGYQEYYYKGIDLYDIQHEVIVGIKYHLEQKLRSLGLKIRFGEEENIRGREQHTMYITWEEI